MCLNHKAVKIAACVLVAAGLIILLFSLPLWLWLALLGLAFIALGLCIFLKKY